MNHLKKISFKSFCKRWCSQTSVKTMKAWQTHKYCDPEDLKLNLFAEIPPITRPSDILVQVHAASVNPLDVMMLQGYGSSIIGAMRQVSDFSCSTQEFPLTVGRDFSGTVVHVGINVTSVQPGDEVWGVVGPQALGSHSDYVVASSYSVSQKPKCISHIEASSFPYAALTAWSALSTFGRLSKDSAYGKRVLVLGGSGGVGVFAIQILRAWGAEVTATCSTDAVEMVQNLGANHVIDYKLQDVKSEVGNVRGFDFILNNVGGDNIAFARMLKPWSNSKYVTIVSPLLSNADRLGLPVGTAISAGQAVRDTVMGLTEGYSVRWAYFIPDGRALKTLSTMVDKKQITSVIDQVFKFEEAPQAYRKILNGHARGKTVISNEE